VVAGGIGDWVTNVKGGSAADMIPPNTPTNSSKPRVILLSMD
jgi:hypothetical protein